VNKEDINKQIGILSVAFGNEKLQRRKNIILIILDKILNPFLFAVSEIAPGIQFSELIITVIDKIKKQLIISLKLMSFENIFNIRSLLK
jgi:hypothetical protein